MTMRIVADRLWLHDYMDRVKQQITETEIICENLEKAKAVAMSEKTASYDEAIKSIKKLREELGIIHETLGLFLEGMDEAKYILDQFVKELCESIL